MVKDRSLFLIDSSSLLEETNKTFLGTPLFFHDGKNVTFLYGFLKRLLRLRRELGINVGIVLVSQECCGDVDQQEIKEAVRLIEKMGVSVIYTKDSSIIDICHKYSPRAEAIYSENEALLQFARQDLCIIRSNGSIGYDYLFSETVRKKYGVDPDKIPTFLSLTKGPKESVITTNQAKRLIEVFGNLEGIFSGRSSFANSGLGRRITENEGTIFARYKMFTPSEEEKDLVINNDWEVSRPLDTNQNRNLLHGMGFHSLTRLLSLPSSQGGHAIQVKSEIPSYEIIDNEKTLKTLRRRLVNTEVCAIDTESSSTDPQSATIFGIAFCGNNGWSCYVPLVDHDLKGISSQKVLSTIKTCLEGGKKFIGHNIKYDYLLLRRNGIHLKSIHFDTMLAAFECYGDLEFLNLGFLSEKFLGKGKLSFKEVLG